MLVQSLGSLLGRSVRRSFLSLGLVQQARTPSEALLGHVWRALATSQSHFLLKGLLRYPNRLFESL